MSSGFLIAAALEAGLLAFGCRGREADIPPGAWTWDGVALPLARDVPFPDSVLLEAEGFPSLQGSAPLRFLEMRRDSGAWRLQVLEFRADFEAYAAFQRVADPLELIDGFAGRSDRGFFRLGRWMGTYSGGRPVDIRLRLRQARPLDWGRPPAIFFSLLHQGRFAGSERVLWSEFLGLKPPVPVFAVQTDCRGDSAWLYAAPGMPVHFSLEIAEQPGFFLDSAQSAVTRPDTNLPDPLRLEFFEQGMTGVEGCFDSALTARWISAQSKALKSLEIEVKP